MTAVAAARFGPVFGAGLIAGVLVGDRMGATFARRALSASGFVTFLTRRRDFGGEMKGDRTKHETIDEYIAAARPEVRPILRKVRATVRKAAPTAEEKISYGIPTFYLNGNLVHFAAFQNHIGFYPPVRDRKLRAEAAVYAGEKGNLRFPLDEPIPYGLIGRLVKARVRENRELADRKKK